MIVTWDYLLERCSRLHTTRLKPYGPWPNAELREASEMIDVMIEGHPAQIVPTRMHEPGFYWRYVGGTGPRRSDGDLAILRRLVDEGKVSVE